MPTPSGPSFYDQIKDAIPILVDTAVGGAVGGSAGAIAGAAGAGEVQGRDDEQSAQRMDKMAQFVGAMNLRKSEMQLQQEYHQDAQKQAKQIHDDNEDLKKLQMAQQYRIHADNQLQQKTEWSENQQREREHDQSM